MSRHERSKLMAVGVAILSVLVAASLHNWWSTAVACLLSFACGMLYGVSDVAEIVEKHSAAMREALRHVKESKR